MEIADTEKRVCETGEQKAVIIGAGPAGLTAAYELLKETTVRPVVFEANGQPGGIACTIKVEKNLIDIGPHRFFSKNAHIIGWWNGILPIQGAGSNTYNHDLPPELFHGDGPDPDKIQEVMLVRKRQTRIFYRGAFFKYPVKLDLQTIRNLGLFTSISAGFRYVHAICFKRQEKNLEDFFINRFGERIYHMFFEHYTEKVWGRHPSQLDHNWGAQRIKNISLKNILKEIAWSWIALLKLNRNQNGAKRLVEEFFYFPKYGAGQMWETVAGKIVAQGGEIFYNKRVTRINIENDRAVSIQTHDDDTPQPCDFVFSSMPFANLFHALKGIDIPDDIMKTAHDLPYRAYLSAGILLDRLELQKNPRIRRGHGMIRDNWMYIQDPKVRVGRVYFMHNFSPYMLYDKDKFLIGAEYFCDEGDALWNMEEGAFTSMAIVELEKIGILRKEDVCHAFQIRQAKAYPAYYGSYYKLADLTAFLDRIENLYCIGRNGQHRYNNMDHAMLTAIEAVRHLKSFPPDDKSKIWKVNVTPEYHE